MWTARRWCGVYVRGVEVGVAEGLLEKAGRETGVRRKEVVEGMRSHMSKNPASFDREGLNKARKLADSPKNPHRPKFLKTHLVSYSKIFIISQTFFKNIS